MANLKLNIDPFETALEGLKIGVSSLSANEAWAKASKLNALRSRKDLDEGMMGLSTTVGSRASSRGLAAGQYSNYLSATRQIGEKQMQYNNLETEHAGVGPLKEFWRSLTGGRTARKIEKDMRQVKMDITKLMG